MKRLYLFFYMNIRGIVFLAIYFIVAVLYLLLSCTVGLITVFLVEKHYIESRYNSMPTLKEEGKTIIKNIVKGLDLIDDI